VYFVPASPPDVSDVSPRAGDFGSVVTLTGSHFGSSRGTGNVTFGGLAAGITSWSDGSIVCTVPAGAASGYVGVWQNGLCSNGVFFTPGKTPSITALSTSYGAVGTTVTVTGTDFGASAGQLTIGGASVTTSSWSNTSVTFVVPTSATAGYVGVWASGVCSNGVYFTPVARVDSLAPYWGSSGTSVTITGAGFRATQGASSVTFGGVSAPVTSWSDTSIVCAVPAGAASGYVGVWRDGACSSGGYFAVMSAPHISDADPVSAPFGGIVTLTGSDFGDTTSTVTVGGVSAPIVSWSATQIEFQVPMGATSGYLGVWVAGVASNGYFFEVSTPAGAGTSSLGTPEYAALAEGVNVASGNLVLAGFSASIPGNGEGTQMSSAYNSQDSSDGPAGPGWTFSFEERLISYPNGCEAWLRPDGSLRVFGRKTDGSYVGAQGTYASLAKAADGSFTLVDRDKMTFAFNADRQLVSKTDRNGNATSFAYGGGGLAANMTDASGRISTFDYDNDGRLITVTDAAGRVTDFEYDAGGRLALMTLPEVTVGPETLRYTIGYDYDAGGRLVGVTDARGNTTTYAYDGATSKVASVIPPIGASTTFAYASAEGSSTVTDASGASTTFGYDAAGAVVHTSGAGLVTTAMTHDVQMNMTDASDATGASVSYEFDLLGRPATETDPAGATTTYSYTPTATASEPAVVAAPGGATTSATYDAAGNKTSETDPLGNTSEYEYDAKGKVTSATDSTGATSAMSYDAVGNLTEMEDASGAVTSLAYNELGLVVSGSDESGISGAMSYDELGRMLSVESAGVVAESYSYDENGTRTAVTDAKGNRVLSVYDEAGALLSVTPDPVILSQEATGSATSVNTGVVEYEYDAARRLSTRTDQAGNTWTLAYDATTGQLLSETDEAGRTTSYARNVVGQVASTLFADGTGASFTYNTLGQTTASTLAGRALSFDYDARGNVTSASVVGGVAVNRTYDVGGRLTSETMGSTSVGYGYDAAGRTTSVSPSGLTLRSYAYDSAGRPTTVTVGSRWMASDYTEAGSVAQVRRSDGVKTTFSYDAQGMTARRAYLGAADATLAAWDYAYDVKGNVASVTDFAGAKQRFFYDNLDQLVNVRDGEGSLLYNYTYDQAGDRITSHDAIEGTTTYSYGDTDTTRLTGMSTPSGAVSFTYDNQGRVTSRTDSSGTTTYTWAYDGYLAGVSLPDGTKVAYDYDASWRMVSRGESSGGATTTVTYQYDGNALVAERDSGGAVLASYVYGPDGRVETMSRGGETYQYVLDDHGSVTAVLDGEGVAVNTYEYDPYGRVVAKTEGVENSFTYSGYRVDADTGLFHLMARWYDSNTGRFLSKDAVQDVQGDPLSANHYLYCKNNPVNMVDPEGTYPFGVHMQLAQWHMSWAVASVFLSWAKWARFGARGVQMLKFLKTARSLYHDVQRLVNFMCGDGKEQLKALLSLIPVVPDVVKSLKHSYWSSPYTGRFVRTWWGGYFVNTHGWWNSGGHPRPSWGRYVAWDWF